jgi:predicted DNA-binding protein
MMKDQRSESLDKLSEHLSKVATNAVANAINADTIAKAIDTNAVMNAVTASLKEARLTNELSTRASIIGEKIGESVAGAIRSAMAVSETKAIMDATTMREQTLSSLLHRSACIYAN